MRANAPCDCWGPVCTAWSIRRKLKTMKIRDCRLMSRTDNQVEMKRIARVLLTVLVVAAAVVLSAAPPSLNIYFIDVEGGQSTLIVTPAGESLLIDTGFPSDGTFSSTPGDPLKARDAQRIVEAARDAG